MNLGSRAQKFNNMGSGFSFGSPRMAEQPLFGHVRDQTSLQREYNLLTKENAVLHKQNTKLMEEIETLRHTIRNSNRSTTPHSGSKRNQTPNTSRTKLYTQNSQAEDSPNPLDQRVQLTLEVLASKDKAIRKLQQKLKVLEEVKKYQLKIQQEAFTQKLKGNAVKIDCLQREVLYFKSRTPRMDYGSHLEDSDLHREIIYLKHRVATLTSQVQQLTDSKQQMQQMVCRLYYQSETYHQESEALDTIRSYFAKVRLQFQQTLSSCPLPNHNA